MKPWFHARILRVDDIFCLYVALNYLRNIVVDPF